MLSERPYNVTCTREREIFNNTLNKNITKGIFQLRDIKNVPTPGQLGAMLKKNIQKSNSDPYSTTVIYFDNLFSKLQIFIYFTF